MSVPIIHCVVPTWNSARTLETTLLSLLGQEAVEARVVVVDSGSGDGTLEICRRYGVQMLYAPPGNMYRAINLGLRGANARWLAYVNSDDWLYADSFRRMIEHGDEERAEIVYGNCDFTDDMGRFLYCFASAQPRHVPALARLGVLGFAQPATIFRRSLFERLGGFNEHYRLCADAEFFFRAASQGATFKRLSGPAVACFRVHAAQQSARRAEEMEVEKKSLRLVAGSHSRLGGWRALTAWRMANAPNYVVRMLRSSALTGRLRLPRSLDGAKRAA